MNGHALVTGATGFLGSLITKRLLAEGWTVTALTQGTSPVRLTDSEIARISWVNAADYSELIGGKPVDLVINAAVLYERPDTPHAELEKVNCEAPLALMHRVAAENSECKFVYFDSFFSKFLDRDTPQPVYTRAKQKLIEGLRQASVTHGGNVVVLRLEHVYGPDDNPKKVIPAIARALLDNQTRIPLTLAAARRDLVAVGDVVEAVMCAIAHASERFALLDCGSGVAVPMREVFETMKKVAASTSVLGFGDIEQYDRIEASCADIRQLGMWGWQPRTSLDSGLTQVVDSLRTIK